VVKNPLTPLDHPTLVTASPPNPLVIEFTQSLHQRCFRQHPWSHLNPRQPNLSSPHLHSPRPSNLTPKLPPTIEETFFEAICCLSASFKRPIWRYAMSLQADRVFKPFFFLPSLFDEYAPLYNLLLIEYTYKFDVGFSWFTSKSIFLFSFCRGI
jgi:hypothetical protein